MQWLLEDFLGATEDMGFLWDALTHALVCSHCGNCCLNSPGHLVILFLFMVWQIQRWQQRESWYSGDTMQDQGLPTLYDLTFFDHLWQQKSEEKKGEEEDQSFPDPVKPRSLPKEAPTGGQGPTAPLQPCCGSESLPKATGTPEQISPQPSSPFRSLPTFQFPTNLPVRNKSTSRSCLPQRKGQFFFGLPSQHSESLETIFLNSNGSSPLKLSAYPSVFFNKLPFLPMYDLLLPHYCSPTQLPTHEAHTGEDLEGKAPDAQQVPPPSCPVPFLSIHLKGLPKDCNGDLAGGEAHKQGLTQERDVLLVSNDQALHPQTSLQGIRISMCLSSSEACGRESWDPRLHQRSLESPSTSPLHPSNPPGVLTRSEAPLRTMKQSQHPKVSEPAMPAPSPTPASLLDLQRGSPIGSLSGSKALWETTEQKEDPWISEPPRVAPGQAIEGYESPWRTTAHKESPQTSEGSVPASCQPQASLSESPKVSHRKGHSVLKNFQENMGYRENPQVKPPMPDPFSSLDCLSNLQEKDPLTDSFGYEPQLRYKANSGYPWGIELPSLDLNPEVCDTRPVCVPSGPEIPWKSGQSKDLCVFADSVPPPSLPSLPLASLSESKDLWDIKGQKTYFWVSDCSEPARTTPLAPSGEPYRINTLGGLPRLETAWKVTEHSKCSWASECLPLALSSPPPHALRPLRFISVSVRSDEATWEDIQRKKKSWGSELPAPSLLQDLHGANLLVMSASEPPMEVTERNENYCVPVSLIWGPSTLADSLSACHINEPFGDQSKHKPSQKVTEPRENCGASKLPALNSLSAPLPEPHADLKFVYKSVQQKEAPSPLVGDPLHPMSQPPTPAEALQIEPAQCSLQTAERFAGATAEVPPCQGQALPEMPSHPRSPAWQWSRELEARLKELRHSPALPSPGPRPPLCSPAAPSSTNLDSWRCPSWTPRKTHPPNLHLHSFCHPSNPQSTAPQPVQDFHCLHPSSQQPQPPASCQAERESQKEDRIKGKTVAQIPSHGPGCCKKANENCQGLRKLSNTGVLALGKRQNKASVLPLAKKRENPRKLKAVECGRENARLGSSTGTVKSHPDWAWRPAACPVSRLSQMSAYRARPLDTLPFLSSFSRLLVLRNTKGQGW